MIQHLVSYGKVGDRSNDFRTLCGLDDVGLDYKTFVSVYRSIAGDGGEFCPECVERQPLYELAATELEDTPDPMVFELTPVQSPVYITQNMLKQLFPKEKP